MTKYCKFCGEVIDADCVVCPKCGKQIEEIKTNYAQPAPVIVNNSASSSASSSATIKVKGMRRHYSLALDILLTCCTGRLWLIWCLLRPKYY